MTGMGLGRVKTLAREEFSAVCKNRTCVKLHATTGEVVFCPPPVFAPRGGRTGDAGIPGGEDRRRRLFGRPRLGARAGREAVQGRRSAAPLPARGASDQRRLRCWRPGAGGARRGHRGGALWHRAVALRGTDPDAAFAQRRHVACTNGRDPRVPLHVRSQDAAAAGRTLPA
jgi:hypothetical protein